MSTVNKKLLQVLQINKQNKQLSLKLQMNKAKKEYFKVNSVSLDNNMNTA